MATPSTKPATKHQRAEQGQGEKDEPGINTAGSPQFHRLGGLNRRDRRAGDPPLHDMGDDEQLNDDQDKGASGAIL